MEAVSFVEEFQSKEIMAKITEVVDRCRDGKDADEMLSEVCDEVKQRKDRGLLPQLDPVG